MFGLFFLYFLGRKFYQLAEQYQQNKWLFAILSIFLYYISGFLVLALLLIIAQFVAPDFADSLSETVITYSAIPIGLLSCWGFYIVLERKWKNAVKLEVESIDDIGKPLED